MSNNLCLETIKIEDGQIYNIKWHNRRCNQTRLALFYQRKPIELQHYINPPQEGLFRCRILYNQNIVSIEYIPYKAKDNQTFKIVQSDIEYSYKYANRELLDSLKKEFDTYDEIIVEKNGLLTDTTIANIAFYDGVSWITPKKPLLEGTMREKLLKSKFLIAKDIKSEDLIHFSNFALMNAMIGFQIQTNRTIYIDRKEKICL